MRDFSIDGPAFYPLINIVASHTSAKEYKTESWKVREMLTQITQVFPTLRFADLPTYCTSVRRNGCLIVVLKLVTQNFYRIIAILPEYKRTC